MYERQQLGEFVYCLHSKELLDREGEVVDLRGQSAEVLAYLAQRRGQLVTKNELIEAVWKDTFVTDDSLVQCIADIRRTLNDADHRIVQTFVKKGYKLNASVAPPTQPIELLPRVAVLAFKDNSNGTQSVSLGDAIEEGIFAELARFGEFAMISRASSLQFRNATLGAAAIAKALDAQYLVEGSHQIGSENLHVTVQLIDAETEVTLWGDTYDHPLDENLETRSEIIQKIAASVGFEVCAHAPSLTAPKSAGALFRFLASGAFIQQSNREALELAEKLNTEAIENDPTSPYGHIGMALAFECQHLNRWPETWTNSKEALAEYHASRALELAPRNSQAHFARGLVHLQVGELNRAELRFQRSIALNPHALVVQLTMAFIPMYRGETALAVEEMQAAKEAHPDHPEWFHAAHAATLRQNREYDAALEMFQKMASVPGSNDMQHAAILVGGGRQHQAEEAMRKFRKKFPHHTVARERAIEQRKFVHTDELNLWLDLIRQAGLPE